MAGGSVRAPQGRQDDSHKNRVEERSFHRLGER